MAGIARTSTVGAAGWSTDTAEVDLADGTVQLAGADADRRSVTILNDADSTGDLYLVAAAGQRSRGVRVVPGAGLELPVAAPVYGYVKSGRAVVYVVAESGTVC